MINNFKYFIFGIYPKDPKFYSEFPIVILKHKKATEEQKESAIKACPSFISFIKNPSYNLKKIVVDLDSINIIYIKNKNDILDYYISKYPTAPHLDCTNLPAKIQIKKYNLTKSWSRQPCKEVQHLIYRDFKEIILALRFNICNSLQKKIIKDVLSNSCILPISKKEFLAKLNKTNKEFYLKWKIFQ